MCTVMSDLMGENCYLNCFNVPDMDTNISSWNSLSTSAHICWRFNIRAWSRHIRHVSFQIDPTMDTHFKTFRLCDWHFIWLTGPLLSTSINQNYRFPTAYLNRITNAEKVEFINNISSPNAAEPQHLIPYIQLYAMKKKMSNGRQPKIYICGITE